MRYGPVPTGLRLAGASRDLAPLKGSKTCFGMIAPGDPQKTIGQNGSGFAKTTLTVWLSSFSTLVTSLYWPAVVAALAGSAANSHVKTTSSAVRGFPSCHWTPFLSLQVTDRPSGETVRLLRLGVSPASAGARVPSGAKPARGSAKMPHPSLSLTPAV